MTILIFTFGILLAIGLFLISADLLKLPSLATQKAMLSAGKQGKGKSEKGVRHCEKNVNRGKPMCSQCLTPLVLLKWVLT